MRGIPCIHANGLATDENEAIGIIASSRTGKTTLSACLFEMGLQLMTDDMLALHPNKAEWVVHPGWPQLRMWPDMASKFSNISLEKLKRVHSRFEKRVVDLKTDESVGTCQSSRSLKRLYLLERLNKEVGDIEIQDIPPGEALIHLLQNSMLADAYKGLGIEQMRLHRLAELIGQVPVKKIVYPSGMNNLPRVCEQIHTDLKIANKA
jgi:hypothetical protein